MSETGVQEPTFEVSEIVRFAGYGDEDVEDPIFESGQLCVVARVGRDDGGNAVYDLLPVGEDLQQTTASGDQAFADEIEKYEAPPQAEPVQVEEQAQEEAPAPQESEAQEEAAQPDVSEETTQEGPPATSDMGFEHDPRVLEMLRSTNDVVGLARGMHDQQQEMNYIIGGIITEIHHNKLHVRAGYEDSSDGFAKYVADTIGPERRKCYMLMDIYRKFRERGLTAEALTGIGWTKAVLLARMSPEDMMEVLPNARDMTRDELIERVQHGRAATTAGAETIRRVSYKFVLYGDANTLVEQALDHAKMQIEETDEKRIESAAFEFISSQYVSVVMDAQMEPVVDLPRNGEELERYAAEVLGLGITVEGPVMTGHEEQLVRQGAAARDAVIDSARDLTVEVAPEDA